MAKDIVYDRGTESWCVLAEFCKAGMVKGLPLEALRALTTRRFASRNGTGAIVSPLRMEDKKQFKTRFKKSPDEADACALAALVAKERYGLVPFGMLPAPDPSMLVSIAAPRLKLQTPTEETWGSDPLDGDDVFGTWG
jgi:hypothetical protein